MTIHGTTARTPKSEVLTQVVNAQAEAFLVSSEETQRGKTRVTVHTGEKTTSRANRKALIEGLRSLDLDAQLRVVTHGEDELRRHMSLESLTDKLAAGEIWYDPTLGFGRAKALVGFARSLRASLGSTLVGAYWAAGSGSLYVVLRKSEIFADGKAEIAHLAALERLAAATLRKTCGETATDFVSALRLGFDVPQEEIVAIDRASHRRERSLHNRLAMKVASSVLGVVVGLGATGAAKAQDASEPAVSGINGKIAVFGGMAADEGSDNLPGMPNYGNPSGRVDADNSGAIFGGEASVTVPLGHSFGAQLDVIGGSTEDSHEFAGVGAQAFWRDPASGLIGIIGSYSGAEREVGKIQSVNYFYPPQCPPANGIIRCTTDDEWFDLFRIGAQGELYLEQFTVAATAGYQWGDTDEVDGFFGSLNLHWYVTDNFVFGPGVEYSENDHNEVMALAHAEFAPGFAGVQGLTMFLDTGVNDGDNYRALFGLRYYLAGDDTRTKTLKDRHRKDDPPSDYLRSAVTNTGPSTKTGELVY